MDYITDEENENYKNLAVERKNKKQPGNNGAFENREIIYLFGSIAVYFRFSIAHTLKHLNPDGSLAVWWFRCYLARILAK